MATAWICCANSGRRDSSSDVILITAAKEVEPLRSALRGGVFDYILKPLVFERLEEAVNRYRDHLRQLSGLVHIAQKEVDALLPRGSSETGQPAHYRQAAQGHR